MRKSIFIPLLIICFVFTSCLFSERVKGSGKTISYEENYKNFDKLDFSNAVDAEVEFGEKFEVLISIDNN